MSARAGVRFDRISTTLEDEASVVASTPSGTEAKEDRCESASACSSLRPSCSRSGRYISADGTEHGVMSSLDFPRGLAWARRAGFTSPRRHRRRPPIRVRRPAVIRSDRKEEP